MKNIFNKIHISSFFIILIFISFISGLFKDVITLFLIIIIHEMGHITTSLFYKWNIKKIDISLCGGYITYDDIIDKPYKEEFLIAISGFLFQTIFYLIILFLHNINILSFDTLFIVKKYHYAIILFNIIPIYPLDGSKILNIILNLFNSYKKSLYLIRIISWILILLIFGLLFYYKKIEYSFLFIISFIVSKLIKLKKDTPYLFNRFLFERYESPIRVRKYVYLKSYDLSKIRRQRKHYFLINKHYYKEEEILRKIFD